MPLNVINLSRSPPKKPLKSPELSLIRKKLKLAKKLALADPNYAHEAKQLVKQARRLSRQRVNDMSIKSNKIFNILISSNPSAAFRAIGRLRSDKTKSIKVLTVGKQTFRGSCVKDGFYASLSSLKSPHDLVIPQIWILIITLSFGSPNLETLSPLIA